MVNEFKFLPLTFPPLLVIYKILEFFLTLENLNLPLELARVVFNLFGCPDAPTLHRVSLAFASPWFCTDICPCIFAALARLGSSNKGKINRIIN